MRRAEEGKGEDRFHINLSICCSTRGTKGLYSAINHYNYYYLKPKGTKFRLFFWGLFLGLFLFVCFFCVNCCSFWKFIAVCITKICQPLSLRNPECSLNNKKPGFLLVYWNMNGIIFTWLFLTSLKNPLSWFS